MKDVINEFFLDGDSVKFFPSLHNCIQIADCVFPRLSTDACLFLGFELTNHVAAYRSHGHVFDDEDADELNIKNNVDISKFTQKENDIISYLSGYVCSTFARRIRNSKTWKSKQNQDSLLSAKVEICDDSMLIDARNRGGLWKVRPEITTIFSVAEIFFKSSTSGIVRSINTKKIIEKLMVNSEIFINYYSVYNDTPEEVEKEVALNLLEHMLTL